MNSWSCWQSSPPKESFFFQKNFTSSSEEAGTKVLACDWPAVVEQTQWFESGPVRWFRHTALLSCARTTRLTDYRFLSSLLVVFCFFVCHVFVGLELAIRTTFWWLVLGRIFATVSGFQNFCGLLDQKCAFHLGNLAHIGPVNNLKTSSGSTPLIQSYHKSNRVSIKASTCLPWRSQRCLLRACGYQGFVKKPDDTSSSLVLSLEQILPTSFEHSAGWGSWGCPNDSFSWVFPIHAPWKVWLASDHLRKRSSFSEKRDTPSVAGPFRYIFWMTDNAWQSLWHWDALFPISNGQTSFDSSWDHVPGISNITVDVKQENYSSWCGSLFGKCWVEDICCKEDWTVWIRKFFLIQSLTWTR